MIVNKTLMNQMIVNQKTAYNSSTKNPVLEVQCEVPSCVFWFALTDEDPIDSPDLCNDLSKNSLSPHVKKRGRVGNQPLTFLGLEDQKQSERKEEKRKPPYGFSSSSHNRRREQVPVFRKGRGGDHLPTVSRFFGAVGCNFAKVLKTGIKTCIGPPESFFKYSAVEKGYSQRSLRRSRNFTGKEGILDAHFKNCYPKKCETS